MEFVSRLRCEEPSRAIRKGEISPAPIITQPYPPARGLQRRPTITNQYTHTPSDDYHLVPYLELQSLLGRLLRYKLSSIRVSFKQYDEKKHFQLGVYLLIKNS